jgi:hypothetical protein
MCEESLPSELAEIERELCAARRTEPTLDLRSRVLSGVREQLRLDRRRKAWEYVATLAASALVWVNVSLSSVAVTSYPHGKTNQRAEIGAWTEEVSTLLPEVSEPHVVRLAVVLRSGSRLAQCPTIPSSTSLCLSERANQEL